jgi:hypothetical protein
MKFKQGTEVVVLKILQPSGRVDVNGIVVGRNITGPNKGKYIVDINSVYLNVEETRLILATEYYSELNSKNDSPVFLISASSIKEACSNDNEN